MRISHNLFLAALLLTAGCANNNIKPVQITPAQTNNNTNNSDTAQVLAGNGNITVNINWPQRNTQTIPLSSQKLQLTLKSGNNTIATASITRPNNTTNLNAIPPGQYTLFADALRADNSTAASGNSIVTVFTNKLVSVSIGLGAIDAPIVTGLSSSAGFANSYFSIYGSNLGMPVGGTFSVLIDNQPVPMSYLTPGSSQIVVNPIPSWTTGNSKVTVVIDGLKAANEPTYSLLTVAAARVVPTAVATDTNQPVHFQAYAYTDSSAISTITVPVDFIWDLTEASTDSPAVFQLLVTGKNTMRLIATDLGSCSVRATVMGSSVWGTASVLINGIGVAPPEP